MVGEFPRNVGGHTSNHAPVSATVSTYAEDGKVLSLIVLGWNMLNHCDPTNNPFKVAESGADYVARKVKQLEFLAEQMKSGIFDCVALQEVDIFTQAPMPEFVRNFLSEVRAEGWQNTHTEQADNTREPFLTFYNTAKLEFVSKEAVFPMSGTLKNCGFEATFKYADTDNLVCINNIHLDYKTDFRETILKYQKQKIADGKFTIIVGDANHLPEIEYYSLVGDKVNRPTSINSKQHLQLTDGFMASPATNQRVVITEGPLVAFFEWVPANLLSKLLTRNDDENERSGKFVCNTIILKPNERLPYGLHVSPSGEPWIAHSHKDQLLSPDIGPQTKQSY